MKRKLNLLLLITTLLFTEGVVKAQVSTPFNFGFPANFVGWNAAQGFPLTVAHKGNQPIDFQTNGTQRMTILPTSGFVGIGNNFSTPNQLLTVDGGNINVQTANQSYMINNQQVLWHKGNTNNIFVGVNSGTANTTGTRNTFVG